MPEMERNKYRLNQMNTHQYSYSTRKWMCETLVIYKDYML